MEYDILIPLDQHILISFFNGVREVKTGCYSLFMPLTCDWIFCGAKTFKIMKQEVPEKTKDSPGGPWEFLGLLPLFDPPRHDSAETIRRALNLGVSVKMITGIT